MHSGRWRRLLAEAPLARSGKPWRNLGLLTTAGRIRIEGRKEGGDPTILKRGHFAARVLLPESPPFGAAKGTFLVMCYRLEQQVDIFLAWKVSFFLFMFYMF